MKSKKQIYLYFTCDAWKSRDSMQLVMATTSQTRMRKFVEKQIMEDDEVRFTNGALEDPADPKAEMLQFRTAWKTMPRDNINDRLSGAYIEYTYDGEEI